jgi:hypothetical protein
VNAICGDESSPTDQTSRQQWPTPRAEMDTGRHRGQADTLHSRVKELQPKARLNPKFVTWLMGLPIGWPDLAPLAPISFERWVTRSCRRLLDTRCSRSRGAL